MAELGGALELCETSEEAGAYSFSLSSPQLRLKLSARVVQFATDYGANDD
jgi:hypothetical protein